MQDSAIWLRQISYFSIFGRNQSWGRHIGIRQKTDFFWRSFGVGIPIIHRKLFLVVPLHSNLQLPVTTGRPWVYQHWPGSWPWEPIMMRPGVGLDYCIVSLQFQGGAFINIIWSHSTSLILCAGTTSIIVLKNRIKYRIMIYLLKTNRQPHSI